jgi:opine dehydrogenase
MREKRVAIIGAGNGGHAAAFELTQKGFLVHLCDINERVIEEIRNLGGIHATGRLEGFAKIPLVTTDLKEAVEGADAILPMVPRYAHRSLAHNLASCLRKDQHILLCPGSTLGEIEFAKVLRENGRNQPVSTVATLPYACRLKEPGKVSISLVTKALLFASFPGKETEKEARFFSELFPTIMKVSNGLEAGLNNGNPVTHPVPTLLNAARIERGESFLFYREGVTPSVARVNQKLDEERMALCHALGFRTISLTERLFLTGYTNKIYNTPLEAYHGSEAFASIMAPKSLHDRYIFEDIPYGLVTFVSLGERLNVPTPTMRLIVDLAIEVIGVDFWKEGMTLAQLGLDGLDRNGLLQFMEEGQSSTVPW